MSPGCAQPPELPLPAALADMPITVLMNARSGNKDKRDARGAIDSAFKAAGRDVELVVARHPRELPQLARQAAHARPGILVAAGGDGTLNAVAAVAHARALPFAVIPLGTFNYFARDLGIPLDPASAARVVTQGTVRRVAVGRVNGKLFLNNASVGLYRTLLEHREVHKRRFGRNRLVALLSALATLLRAHRTYRLRLDIDGRAMMLPALTVFFGRNALQMEQLGLDEALCVARGELAVLALPPANRLDLLGLILRGAAARLENAEDLQQYCARTVRLDRVDGRTRRMRVALDGESIGCTLPLVIESVPDALQVVVPVQPEARQ